MEQAREAFRADVTRIAELWSEAQDELGKQRGGSLLFRTVSATQPVEEALRRAISDPGEILAVGTIDDVVVGFGFGSLRDVHPDETTEVIASSDQVGVVEVLYVEPEARGVGVGEALIDFLANRFAQLGCLGLDAFALPGNRAAKAFFETHGFVTRLLVMHRDTSGNPR